MTGYPISYRIANRKRGNMKIEDLILPEVAKKIEADTDFIVSWFAKKYNKTIFRVGHLNKEGCRVWEQGGKKYMCFWDTALERYTTCINPMITFKKARN